MQVVIEQYSTNMVSEQHDQLGLAQPVNGHSQNKMQKTIPLNVEPN